MEEKSDEHDLERLWRVRDFASWLGVCPKNIYNHLSDEAINPDAFRRWGGFIVFLPWKCRKLLEVDALFLRPNNAKRRQRVIVRRRSSADRICDQ